MNVLIVDDEKLVRKGIIYTLPWEKHGFQIVGEAANGQQALEFIEKGNVDIAFIDLSMPVMTGMELMEIIAKRHPEISMVVLTCHQDFTYIQEALRYGAIDYIVKTQLDEVSMEQALSRIGNTISLKNVSCKNTRGGVSARKQMINGIIILDPGANDAKDIRLNNAFLNDKQLIKLDKLAWFVPFYFDKNMMDAERIFTYTERVIITKVTGIEGMSPDSLIKPLLDYIGNVLFYDYKIPQNIYTLYLEDMIHFRREMSSQRLVRLNDLVVSMLWICNSKATSEIMTIIEVDRPRRNILIDIFLSLRNQLTKHNELTKHMKIIHWDNQIEAYFDKMDTFLFWSQFKDWFYEIKKLIGNNVLEIIYSNEIKESILRAINYIDSNLEKKLNQEKIATSVGISRVYFSECFKNLVGISFSEYIKQARMDQAKHILVSTDERISVIARRTGFIDEKYFSRIFRKQFGILPSEYRIHECQGRDRYVPR